jgi:catechol 2,3-dioxygenase-like lactoylglutathione lyase family enzyme
VRDNLPGADGVKRSATGKETIVVKIKHIAIRTPDPEKTATFYKEVFGLKEVGQARAGYYLSDGYLNLAILKSRDEGTDESPRDGAGYAGIHHLGFMVDDVDEVCRKLDAAGATPMTSRTDLGHGTTEAGARSYYEIKYRGPDNQEFDVTESGWIGT